MANNQEYLENLYRELYYFEHERKERINTNRSTPIAILTVLSGVLIYYAQNFPVLDYDIFSILFIVFGVLASYSIVRSIFFLHKTFFEFSYDYLISPKEIDDVSSELRVYYNEPETLSNLGEIDIEAQIIDDIQYMVTGHYKKSTNNNIESNDNKQHSVNMCLKWIFRSLVLLILSMLPFYIINSQIDDIQKIEIIKYKCGDYHGRK